LLARMLKEAYMAQVYFHCSNARGILMDRRGTSVSDLIEACEEATSRVRSLIASISLEDWRDWALHVSDAAGDEIFVLPFAFVLGKAH